MFGLASAPQLGRQGEDFLHARFDDLFLNKNHSKTAIFFVRNLISSEGDGWTHDIPKFDLPESLLLEIDPQHWK